MFQVPHMNHPNIANTKYHPNFANTILYESRVQVKPDPRTLYLVT